MVIPYRPGPPIATLGVFVATGRAEEPLRPLLAGLEEPPGRGPARDGGEVVGVDGAGNPPKEGSSAKLGAPAGVNGCASGPGFMPA